MLPRRSSCARPSLLENVATPFWPSANRQGRGRKSGAAGQIWGAVSGRAAGSCRPETGRAVAPRPEQAPAEGHHFAPATCSGRRPGSVRSRPRQAYFFSYKSFRLIQVSSLFKSGKAGKLRPDPRLTKGLLRIGEHTRPRVAIATVEGISVFRISFGVAKFPLRPLT
jgi:hypothetical protein